MRDMYYYLVALADKNYRGDKSLSYSYDKKLKPGQIVEISLRGKNTLGFIVELVVKPSFRVKPLVSLGSELALPPALLKLYKSMVDYYPPYIGAVGQLIAPSFLKRNDEIVSKKASKGNEKDASLVSLNKEQREAYDKITNSSSGPKTLIVHGETGSGKTRLYLELTKNRIASNKSVVILTPEISLTTPLASQFTNYFGDIVIINHSNLTDKQRYQNWRAVQESTTPQILIGPRSTIFMPARNLGLIVIDEFHDQSYKQDTAPYYSAIRVASMLSSHIGATLVMGSATPPISELFIAEQKDISVLRLLNQAVTNKPAELNYKVIDLTLKEEKSRFPLLSNSLIKQLAGQLSQNKQSMVFINKRGSARSIICQNCGWRATCPSCDLPMTYHADNHKLLCHTCGHPESTPQNCPDCGSVAINFKSPGTKMIEENLAKIFPEAKIVRFDKDNKKDQRMENNYQSLVNGEADIIVGTQLITKGHDLPKLGLVAILQAEAGLDFPDYTSEEKSYQLIKQLLGRVNRGHTRGIVLMQTFDTRSPAIKYAAKDNWQKYYQSQISQRKSYGLPPFSHVLKIQVYRKSRQSAQKNLSSLVDEIKTANPKLEILGPTPSFIEKKSGNYSWQIIVKAKKRTELTQLARNLRGNYKINLDPANFL